MLEKNQSQDTTMLIPDIDSKYEPTDSEIFDVAQQFDFNLNKEP